MWREITKALRVFCFVSFVYRGEEGIQLQLLFFRKSVTISEGNRLNRPKLVSSGFSFLDFHLVSRSCSLFVFQLTN